MTRGEVKARIRSLVDDVQASYTDDAFLDPLVQQEYEAAASELEETKSPFDEQVVVVPNIAAATADLSAFQAAGKPLETMVLPERIDWKPQGQPDFMYRLLPGPKDMLPDLPAFQAPVAWEWREEIIYFTPSTMVIDLRIRGEFDVPKLRDDGMQLTLHKRIGYVVAFRVAALIAKVRGNQQWIQDYAADAQKGMDEIAEQMTRAEQGKVRRIGRMTRRNGTRGRFNY
ncbi:MAG: hypothetical protein ACJ71S_06630 [Acidobacteriaceae bacterium]